MKPAYQDNLSTLYITEALEGASLLEPESVHAVCTSPPYHGLRSYLPADHPDKGYELGTEQTPEEFVDKLCNVFDALKPALRGDGTLWCNLGNSYFSSSTKHPVFKPKDLVPVAWMVGLEMMRRGWFLRSDICWSKGNPMPSSVTDRPSTSHEYVLMFSKKPRYFFDMEAVKEKALQPEGKPKRTGQGKYDWHPCNGDKGTLGTNQGTTSRNLRTVWNINTTPYSGSHFAVFPIAIPDRIIRAATSERGVCGSCGAPWKRVVEKPQPPDELRNRGNGAKMDFPTRQTGGGQKREDWYEAHPAQTVGWEPGCSCRTYKIAGHTPIGPGVERIDLERPDTVPATVLDPFVGSGTTLLAARKLGRRSIGFDLDARSVEHVGNRLGYQEVLL